VNAFQIMNMLLIGTIYFSSDEVGGRIHSPKSV
jgi:hypothetical protein